MNEKYFVDLKNEAPKNGDTAFVMAVIKVLKKADAFIGMILYQKDHSQHHATLTYTTINDAHCAIISFSDRVSKTLLQDAITKAYIYLAELAGCCLSLNTSIFYHQDEKLLEAQPEHITFCITHHVPIVDDVTKYFPKPEDVLDAFGTDTKSWQKINDLKTLQAAGLEQLRIRENGFVLQMSDIQGQHFRRSGVDPGRIFPFPPPLHAMLTAYEPKSSTKPLVGVTRRHFLFTAVARLTFFKHVELLINGAILLLQRGLEVSILIAGGDGSQPHSENRASLFGRVPSQFHEHVHIIERIPQEDLYAYFSSSQVQQTGIFVCSSRYETLGMTPLEAALSGVTTVITDTEQVEATRYFPEWSRFDARPEALADRLMDLFQHHDLLTRGQDLKSHIEGTIRERGDFETEFLKAWWKVSNLQSIAPPPTHLPQVIKRREEGTESPLPPKRQGIICGEDRIKGNGKYRQGLN